MSTTTSHPTLTITLLYHKPTLLMLNRT
jgi:hypothetical protein